MTGRDTVPNEDGLATIREVYEVRDALADKMDELGKNLSDKIEGGALRNENRLTLLEASQASLVVTHHAIETQVATLQTSHDMALGHMGAIKSMLVLVGVLFGGGGIVGVAELVYSLVK